MVFAIGIAATTNITINTTSIYTNGTTAVNVSVTTGTATHCSTAAASNATTVLSITRTAKWFGNGKFSRSPRFKIMRETSGLGDF